MNTNNSRENIYFEETLLDELTKSQFDSDN